MFATIIWLVGIPIMALLVLVEVPRNCRSLFRYKLWNLRDEIYDAARADSLAWNDELRAIVDQTELYIKSAPILTPLRLFLIYVFLRFRGAIRSVKSEGKADVFQTLTTEQRKIAASYRNRLLQITCWHLLTGSPSGWFIAAPLFLLVVLYVFLILKPYYAVRSWIGKRGANQMPQASAPTCQVKTGDVSAAKTVRITRNISYFSRSHVSAQAAHLVLSLVMFAGTSIADIRNANAAHFNV